MSEDLIEEEKEEQQPEEAAVELTEEEAGRKKEEERADRVRSIVAQYRADAKNPNIILFEICLPDNDEIYIGKVGSFERAMKYAQLMTDEKVDNVKTQISFIQEFLVYPKLSEEQIARGMKPGSVIAISAAIQKANGFEDEAEIKKV